MILDLIKRYWILPIMFIRNCFKGFMEIVWGIVGIALLSIVVSQYNQEVPLNILKIGRVIMDNFKLIVWSSIIVFFSFDFLAWKKLTHRTGDSK